MKVRARVMVAVPCYSGYCAIELAMSLQNALLHCLQHDVIFEVVTVTGASLVQLGRNWLVAEFLERKHFTHLLWLDDDLAFSPDGIIALLDADKDCVGGVYLAKHAQKPFFAYKASGARQGQLQPASRLPIGFTLVKRHVVEDVASKCETFMYEHDGKNRATPHVFDIAIVPNEHAPGNCLLGEDFLFCKRVIDAGHEVWVHGGIVFSHFGRHAWTGRLAQTWADEAKAGIKGEGAVT